MMTGGRKQVCRVVFILVLIFFRRLAVIRVKRVTGSHLTKEILQDALSYCSGSQKAVLKFYLKRIDVDGRKLGISAQERTKQVSNIMYLLVFKYTVDIHFKGDSEVQVQF